MPRGDGTGPAGGGGRRRGRGMGRGRGWGQSRRMGRNLQTGVENPMAETPSALMSPPSRKATPVACVDEKACTPCGACQAVCPTEAITLGDVAVRVNAELCCGCGACVEVCPNSAITLN
jgi:ferredoxin